MVRKEVVESEWKTEDIEEGVAEAARKYHFPSSPRSSQGAFLKIIEEIKKKEKEIEEGGGGPRKRARCGGQV